MKEKNTGKFRILKIFDYIRGINISVAQIFKKVIKIYTFKS